MPINFVTGLPRQGKTLFTFIQVQERAKAESRPVFYCNIPEVTLEGWTEIDHPDKWMECPNDALIVVDELQDFWGMAPPGAKVSPPILELSKHGKRGIDFYFITQDPTLVHATPRKLCEVHWHVVRAFGSENAVAHKFNRMQTDPERVKSKSEKYPWRYPKEAFGKKDKAGNWITKPWYKSADVHNIKRQIPLKVWAIPGGIVAAGLAIWLGINLFSGMLEKAKGAGNAQNIATAPMGVARPAGAPGAAGPGRAGPITTAEYLQQRDARVPGFPHTAPAYDQVTQPTQAPYPAACVSMGKRCDCYTQQATLMVVSREVCIQIVERGFFMDWKREQQQMQAQQQGQHLPRAEMARGMPPGAVPIAAAVPSQAPQPQQQSSYLEALAARNAQVRSSLQN